MNKRVTLKAAALDAALTHTPGRALRGSLASVAKLTASDRVRMLELFLEYYADVDPEQFERDLAAKTAVIVLRASDTGRIEGFSTLLNVDFRCDGRPGRGVFSGDTVVAKEFWGTRVLAQTFFRYMFIEKMKAPWKPLYWFLISKGYKTYLLLTNSFTEYYPRFDRKTPTEVDRIMREFYTDFFPGQYDAQAGLVRLAGVSTHVKSGVAEITDELARKEPKIAYFRERNPQWKEGVELAAVGIMKLHTPIFFAAKTLVRKLQKACGVGR